ncbi:MAG: radical SAM protein [Candidatus Altiarchaeota archaeon]
MATDLLLINAADAGLVAGGYPYPPLGLAYVAASVRQAGFQVAVEDLSFAETGHVIESVEATMRRVDPTVVGIYGLTSNRLYISAIAKTAKDEKPGVFVVGGGPHMGFTAGDYLKEGLFDGICRREGEQAMVELMSAVKSSGSSGELEGSLGGLLGWSFRVGGKPVHNRCHPFNEDLDCLPFPAWDLFDIPRYYIGMCKKTFTSFPVSTSRGCAFACMFCSGSAFTGRKVRYRSPENVLSEVRWLYGRFNPELIQFVDDTFTSDRGRVIEIAKGMGRIDPTAIWTSNITISTVDRELLKIMRDNGCKKWNSG